MRAVILKEAGNTDKLLITELEKPVPGSEDVLIQVKAISINPVDIKTRKGMALYKSLQEYAPVILGWDISGVVESTGKAVTSFKEGDEVFGMVNFPGHGKAYAEYVVAPANQLAIKPNNITHQQAAASTLALLTAWQVLTQQIELQKGQKILIQAAAGGVGHFAVQIAKHIGAHVIGTASSSNEELIRQLGADEFIDYTKTSFENVLSDIDVVFDTVGGDTPMRALPIIKHGGKIVGIAGGITDDLKEKAKEKDIRAISYLVHSSGEDMKELAKLLEKGEIKPIVSHEFPLSEIKLAHQQIETGKTRGKIIVIP